MSADSRPTRDFPAGRRLGEAAETFLADPQARPVEARLASTVLLVRDGEREPVEVFMLRRVSTMAFAPSSWVFPGGGVDPRDAETQIPWAGPSAQEWAGRIGVDEDVARQLVCAAVREVFEECGVLLAGPDESTVVADLSDPQWEAERQALLSKEQSFAQLLARRHLVLRTDLLSLRDHWVTPPFEPRRYDTYFFTALLPDGQVPDDATTEADVSTWVQPRALLAEATHGEAMMLPPTVVNVERVARAASAAELVAERPEVLTVMPEPIRTDDGVVLRIPLAQEDS